MLKRILGKPGCLALGCMMLAGLVIGGLALRRGFALTLPAPTGPYAVGRVILEWTDDTRAETFSGSVGPRKIAVWIWYPADRSASTPAPYMPPDWARAREADRGAGSLFFQSLGSIRPHAVEDGQTALKGAPYPVLIFQPGLGPLVGEYATLAEDMASRGYVVLGLNPTYSASLTVLDGQVIPRTNRGSIADNATSAETQRQAERLVAVWAEDVRFAIDEATRLDTDSGSPFMGRLDTGRVGLWGHSLGGAAALEACHLDERCTAAADLDGTPFGTVTTAGLDKPVLFEWSETLDRSDPMIAKAERDARVILAAAPEGYQVTISGARHFNFTDLAVGFNPAAHLLGAIGPIDGTRGLRISADYLAAFFDETLNQRDSILLHGPSSAYPEAEFQYP